MKGNVTFTFLLALWLAGCGNVGNPIAPEHIGIAAKLKKEQMKQEQEQEKEKEKEQAAQREAGRAAPEAEPSVETDALPEFRPIGTPR